jgi:uncharacterized protein (DUF58 family)
VIPTRRTATLAGIAVGVAVAASLLPALRFPLFGLDLLVLAAAADAAWVRGRGIAVRREVASIFSVGRANPVTLHLKNHSGRVLRGVVADDPVQDALIEGLPATFSLAPLEEAVVRYEITPTRRGPRELGAVTVRWDAPLGLVARQERTALPARVDVYPDVHAARGLELLRRQGREDARLGSLRVRGGDTEFERLRPYQRGDEIRHIDWRATARRDEPVVRQFQAESNQNVVFAVDLGRGMRGAAEAAEGRPALTAVDAALNAALLAADVALRGGDRAGLLAFDDAPRVFVRPEGGRHGARKLARAAHALDASLAPTDYRAATAFLRAQVRARSLVVVLTNLLEPRAASELASSLEALLPRHLPLCVLVRDPEVEALVTAPVEGQDGLYVRAAAAEALAQREALLRRLERRGVLVLDCDPRDLTPELVRRYLEVKARRLL